MKWKEFKTQVESNGIVDTTEITYIDIAEWDFGIEVTINDIEPKIEGKSSQTP